MRVTPEMLAAAWGAWHARHGGKLGPGAAFREAIEAALALVPAAVAPKPDSTAQDDGTRPESKR